MLAHTLHLLALCANLATATNLFVSSYAGNITTLSLTETNGSYDLSPTFFNDGCAPNPSWLTLDVNHDVLYCLDEGLTVVNGTLSSFVINRDGSLELVQKRDTINGPVSGVIYGDAGTGRAIALAHYVGSAISDWTLDPANPGNFSYNQNITFSMSEPGPNAVRQDAPHEHQAVLDPTGQFLLFPDLGADLIRVYSFDPSTLSLIAETPLEVAAGSGPRHAVFYNPYSTVCENCTSYLMVVSELTNMVTSFRVSYPEAGGMAFEQVYNTSSYGPDLVVPVNNTAAEILVSPDNRFLLVSNRNNTSFSLPNPDSTNSTTIASDSISTFELNHDGTLTFQQLWPAGGSFPRHMSLNKWGTLLAVGLQESEEVVILKRDPATGNLGRPIARAEIEGQVTTVVWQE